MMRYAPDDVAAQRFSAIDSPHAILSAMLVRCFYALLLLCRVFECYALPR